MTLRYGQYLGKNKQSFNANGIFITDTRYEANVFDGWHSHENHHLTYILSGGTREQRKGREFESLPGQIVPYNSGERHKNFNTRYPSRNINLEISQEFIRKYEVDCYRAFRNLPSVQPDAKFAILKIYQECIVADRASDLNCHSLLLNILTIDEEPGRDKPKWLKTLTEILNDEWNENHSLEELSEKLRLHPVTVSKAFPKYFQCTLGSYIRKIRIEKAILLMSKSELTLTSISHECGFYDQSHFIRYFKAFTGMLPKDYKKM